MISESFSVTKCTIWILIRRSYRGRRKKYCKVTASLRSGQRPTNVFYTRQKVQRDMIYFYYVPYPVTFLPAGRHFPAGPAARQPVTGTHAWQVRCSDLATMESIGHSYIDSWSRKCALWVYCCIWLGFTCQCVNNDQRCYLKHYILSRASLPIGYTPLPRRESCLQS